MIEMVHSRHDHGLFVIVQPEFNLSVMFHATMIEEFVRDLDHIVEDGTCRKRLYKRQSRHGAGSWNEFLRWYDYQKQLAYERWCEAPNIIAPLALRHTDTPHLGPFLADILYQDKRRVDLRVKRCGLRPCCVVWLGCHAQFFGDAKIA